MIKKLSLITFTSLFILTAKLSFADDDVCFDCHSDPTLTTVRDGKTISLFIKQKSFLQSVHGENGCVSCHDDVDEEDLPHDTPLKKVECSNCHDAEAEQYTNSLHGRALAQNDPDAPTCDTCHGKHYIRPPTDPNAPTYIMNIPALCGKCHREGSKMAKRHNIPEKDVLQNYSMSIHGEGLFKRGLIVTAVCTSCHTSHNILPHTDPNSSINRKNIAKTCTQCHSQIEKVHVKVIRGELWEKKPHQIPACIDCHSPHKIRRAIYADQMTNEFCMSCHGKRNLVRNVAGKIDSLFIDLNEYKNSVHGSEVQCVKCHVNVSHAKYPVCKNSGPVDCSICHAETQRAFFNSIHGELLLKGDPSAPTCGECHGEHNIKSSKDVSSPTFARNIPQLCGKCHRAGEPAAVRYEGEEHNVVEHYTMSIHGKGLLESGLMVSAVCTSCHSSHFILPKADPRSTVSKKNISKTCGNCHLGIYEEFKSSIHSPTVAKTDKPLPTCNNCHTAHEVERVDKKNFRQQILGECGTCHEDETETYFKTYHGKVSLLQAEGSEKTAKCSDCHGAHNILPVSDPKSTLSAKNEIETCKKCHPNSNRKFVGYLTHATHHNRTKYPFLFYTFWAMTILLIGTFTFFGFHTLLWLPRSFFQRLKQHKELRKKSVKYYVRFQPWWRLLHIIVILSFFGLAITGMTLKFAGTKSAVFVAGLLGGFETAGLIHRLCAILTFFYFAAHFFFVYRNWKKSGQTLIQFIFNRETGLAPHWNDAKEFFQTIKWFVTGKKRPNYGRWTYWEKFDYFAVFWGVAIIGFTGLILWFPEFFTHFLPGWMINVATIIHSDEALLAVGFIFTFHFFNTHFRPEKFPMDPVIFTGKVPLEEFKMDRPREYEMVKDRKELRSKLRNKPSKRLVIAARIFGFCCLLLGYAIVALIIYAMIFQYK